MLKKIVNHIFRGWDKDDHLPHPLLYLVPPFLLEVMAVLLIFGLILQVILFLVK